MIKQKTKYIVGIGASAGGLEALSEFLKHLDQEKSAVSFIIAQHLSPHYKSMLVQLLGRETRLPVLEAQSGLEILPKHIYIAPPDTEIEIQEDKILLSRPSSAIRPKPSVDLLLMSLAKTYQKYAVGVILSGTGSDGAEGIKAIRAAGGYTFAQSPASAKYDGMPSAAINIGEADFVLTPAQIAEKINDLVKQAPKENLPVEIEQNIENSNLDKIFALLSKRTGTNFANYKPSTICRRLERRLQDLNMPSLEAYLLYVQDKPQEVDKLFNTILIGTTAFFRDEQSFEFLEVYIKKIIATKKKGEQLRVWIAGCATGEEAYTFAILFAEILQERIKDFQLQIFATDIDTEAIAFARRGIYHKNSLEKVKPQILEQYFIQKDENHYELIKSIRNMVLFSKHDLTTNPPFVHLDLISCRNVMIYFGTALQKQVFPIFHYALSPRAYLFLGKSESIGQFNDLFEAVESRHKIFQRKMGNNFHNIRFGAFKPVKNQLPEGKSLPTFKEFALQDAIKDTLYEHADEAFVVVNDSLDIIEIKGNVRNFLNFPQGKTHLNLLKLVHENLQVTLRGLFNRVLQEKTSLKTSIRKYQIFEKDCFLRLRIKPVYQSLENIFIVFFESYDLEQDFAQNLRPSSEKNTDSPQVLELEHELAALKEHLQTYIEEVETSNEELQALNEELQSANEELQSTNEELETSNEELQSSNEELQIAYGELKSANESLEIKDKIISQINANFEALLSHTQQGFMLVEKNYVIRLFNPKASQILAQFTAAQIHEGSSLLDILPVGQVQNFISDFRKALEGKDVENEEEIKSQEANYWIWWSYTPIFERQKVVAVALSISDITVKKQKEIEIFEQKEFFKSLVHADSAYLIRTDLEGKYTFVNESFCKKFGYNAQEIIGKPYFPTVHPDDLGKCTEAAINCMQNPNGAFVFQIRKPNPQGGFFETEWQFVAIKNPKGEIVEIQGIGFDISEHTTLNKKLESERDLLALMVKGGRLGTWIWNVKTSKVEFNEEWTKILGYTNQEVQNFEQWKNLIHPQDRKKVIDKLEEILQQKTNFYEIEHRKIAKNGEIKWILLTGKASELDEKRQVWQVIGIHQDITDRKKAEEAKKLIEARTQSIFEAMQEGIVVQNMNGQIISCNRSAERILGLSQEQMMGRTSLDGRWQSIHEDGSPFEGEQHPIMVTIRTLQPQRDITMGIHRPDGSLVWININSDVLYYPNTQEPYAVFATFDEITAIKNAQITIKTEKRRLQDILDGTNVGTWEWNVQTGETIFNERWANIIGYTLAELQPISIKTWTKFSHPEDLNASNEALEKHFRGETAFYEAEIRMKHKNGSWVWVLDRGKVFSWTADAKPLWVSGTRQDITARKEQEQAIRISQERLDLLASHFPDGSISLIDRELNFLYTGGTGYRNFAIEPKQLIGKPIKNILLPEIYKKLEQNLPKVWKGENLMLEVEYKGYFFQNRIQPILDDNQNVSSFVMVVVDITERKQQELTILRQNEDLAAAEEELRTNLEDLRQLYEQVEISENKLKAISDNTPDANWLLSPRFEVLFFNRTAGFLANKFFQKDMEEGQVIWDFLNPQERESFKLNFEQALKGNAISIEKEFSLTAQIRRWFEIKYFPVYNHKDELVGVSVNFTDIQERKENEKMILKTYEKLSQLEKFIDLSTDAIQVADTTGRLVYINKTASERLGIKKSEAGLYFVQDFEKTLQSPQDWEHHLLLLNQQPEGITFEGINLHLQNQKLFPVEVRVKYVQVEKQKFIVAVSRDITLRKKQEAELQKLAIVAQKTSNMVVVTDAQTRIEWVNATFEQITEWTLDEIKGKSPSEFLQGAKSSPTSKAYMREKIQQKLPFETEIINYTKSGRKYWVSIKANPIFDQYGNLLYYISLQSDITSQKRVQQKLMAAYQESKNFQNALESSSIILLTDTKHNIISANPAFYELYGYEKMEVLGLELANIFGNVEQMWEKLAQQQHWHGEVTTFSKQGHMIYLRCVINPVLNVQQEIYQYLIVAFDITQQRQAEDALKKQQEEHQLFLEEKVAQRTSELLEQKQKVEQASKRIKSSIFYAKRIQNVILPSEKDLKKHFKDYFVYNLPKDIVSGDFYWLGKQDDKVIFSVLDCTGHGVPGAFMSMLAYSLLNEIVFKENTTSVAGILQKLDENVRFALKQSESTVQDGLDMAICIIDKQNQTITMGGAKNPVIYIENQKLEKIDGSRRHIGGKMGKNTDDFTQTTIPLNTEQIFYMFSDGYADQFGSPQKQKFSRKRFEDLLLEIHQQPMLFQQDILDQTFIGWMSGFGLRLDDVLVVGFKIL